MKTNLRYLIYSLLPLFLLEVTWAREPLRGQILDLKGQPIPSVQIMEVGRGVQVSSSDARGEFTLILPDSVETITLSFICEGYRTKVMQLAPQEQVYRILLLPSDRQLSDVVVRAHRLQQVSSFAPLSTQLSTLQVLSSPRALADILGALSESPEVQVSDTDGRLAVQGGAPGETQVYVDGLLLPTPYTLSSHNGGRRTTISPSACQSMRLYSGGYSAAYGEALSGIVALETLELSSMPTNTELSLSLLGGSVASTLGSTRAKLRLQADYTDLTLMNKLIPSYYPWRRSFHSPSFSATFASDVKGSKIKAQLSYRHMGFAYDRLPSRLSTLLHTSLGEDQWYGRVTLRRAITSQLQWELGGHTQLRDLAGAELEHTGDRVQEQELYAELRSALRWRISDALTWLSGLDYSYRDYRQTYRRGREYRLGFRDHLGTLFSELSWLSQGFTVSLGLRGSYSTYLRELGLSPRLYAGYRWGIHLLSASWGYYQQMPSADILRFTSSLTRPAVSSTQLTYGLVSGGHSLQLALYHKWYSRLVRSFGSSYPLTFDQQGGGESYGANLIYTGKMSDLNYSLAYGYTHARLSYDRYHHRLSPDYLSPHTLKANLRYWARSLSSLIGVSYYIDSGATGYDASLEPVSIPHRQRLDLSWTYVISPRMVIYTGCQNILGTTNYWGFDPSYGHDDPSGLRRTPSSRMIYLGIFFSLGRKPLNI
nr:TonB-dependent receptor [uncultured Porphyromonas sp.]